MHLDMIRIMRDAIRIYNRSKIKGMRLSVGGISYTSGKGLCVGKESQFVLAVKRSDLPRGESA